MKKNFILLLTAFCIGLCGCGGGSGDSAGGLSPEKQEYADVFLAFVSRVNEKKSKEAMDLIMADLVYNNNNNGHEPFKNRLENYLSKIDDPIMTVGDIGVEIIDNENKLANVRAHVSYKKNNSGESMTETLQIQVDCESIVLPGIKRFHAMSVETNEGITAFPPVLTAN